MPLWNIYHPVDAYTPTDKRRFAHDITELYTRVGLPRFYVVALFHEVPESSYFVGGEPNRGTVRITVDQFARHMENATTRRKVGELITKLADPYTRDRGYYVELTIDETPRDLWMIDGLRPPPENSDAEKLWARENRPIPY